ncbi:MAG: hypothetical protein KAS12_06570, partial [Candidatus Aenigmarchaeota archaeon]|nr:hypothetical protein [Candidatus Aenigmarchaeota archaeon]
ISPEKAIAPEQVKKMVGLTKRIIERMGKTKNGTRLTTLFGMLTKNIFLLKQKGVLDDTILRNLKKGPVDDVSSILNGLDQLEARHSNIEQS